MAVADPTSSQDWVMGFFATSVMLNGGAAGPAGVVGHCLCQNADATDAEVIGAHRRFPAGHLPLPAPLARPGELEP